MYRPFCFLQANPWRPFESTHTPQMHWWGWHKVEPSWRLQAILRDIGSRCKPSEGIGKAFNQTEALSAEVESILAISTLEVVDWSKSRYFLHTLVYPTQFTGRWTFDGLDGSIIIFLGISKFKEFLMEWFLYAIDPKWNLISVYSPLDKDFLL